jgi:hypothetical protein
MTTVGDARRSGTPFPLRPLSLPRLYLLRIGYAVFGIGLAVEKWPAFLTRSEPLPLTEGVVDVMLVAMSILVLVGLRYPMQMLPIMLFESLWKLIWLGTVAVPLWRAGTMDAATAEMAFAVSFVVIVLVTVPWDHVVRRYVRQPGDRWRSERAAASEAASEADRIIEEEARAVVVGRR